MNTKEKIPALEEEEPAQGKQILTSLPLDELTILALIACINDLRKKNATRDQYVDELESDLRKEEGMREKLQQKNARLQIRSLEQEEASVEKGPKSSGYGGGALIGIFIAGFMACYFFLLLAGVLLP